MKKRICSFFLIVIFMFSLTVPPAFGDSEPGKIDAFGEIVCDKNNIQQISGAQENSEGLLLTEGSSVKWLFSVKQADEYALDVYYAQETLKYSKISFSITVDGEYPFSGAENLKLDHIWKYESEKIYDSQGNEIRNKQVPITGVYKKNITVIKDFSEKSATLNLSEGEHTLEIFAKDDSFTVEKIVLHKLTNVVDYNDYLNINRVDTSLIPKKTIKIQAEDASAKSDKSILSQNERNSVKVEPYDSIYVRYNCIGGDSWSNIGDWVEWDIDVPESGVYNLNIRYKQNLKTNDISHRDLYIDGQMPFTQADNIEFRYDSKWNILRLSDSNGEPMSIFLSKGKHTIRLSASSGNNADLLVQANSILSRLNEDFLSILMITGSDADIYRDYKFDTSIPETIKDLKNASKELKELEIKCKEYNGGGASTAIFGQLYDTIDNMTDDTNELAKNINTFDSNISSFSSWIYKSQVQPLLVDYISLTPENTKKERAEGGLLSLLWHNMKQFVLSYTFDYATVGNTAEKTNGGITVWTFTSQEQTTIIQRLATNTFVPEKNIPVNIQLINKTALLPAILAGLGPDVALGLEQTTPVNYALRNAIVDLNQFSDIEQVKKYFSDSSLVPFYLNDGLYALPETQIFYMLFYRKDIIQKMGIELSQLNTWDSILTEVLPELQLNHLTFGLPQGLNSYLLFLYQQGGKLYSDDHLKTLIDGSEGTAAFKKFTSLYKEYNLPLTFSFINRFRTGQMPIGIENFNTFNTLNVSAPEIEGLWGMLPVPGIACDDGTVRRDSTAVATGCSILNEENKSDSWEFLKWWVSDETQLSFSQELEIILGSAARNATANISAFNKLGWEKEMLESINEQRNHVVGFEEIAGGYYTSRYFSFAFADVIYDNKDIIETLAKASNNINAEIRTKTEELLLND